MLGYLRKEQGRYAEALQGFRDAVAHDAEYLNAWRHLHELASHTYIEPDERDIAVLKLVELDPRQRHVSFEVTEVSDLRALWLALDKIKAPAPAGALYPLARSGRDLEAATAALPSEARQQLEKFRELSGSSNGVRVKTPNARQGLAHHVLIGSITPMLGGAENNPYDLY
jgi:hypothetical protein